MPRVIRPVAVTVCCLALLAACGGDGPSDDVASADATGDGVVDYPITVTNCEEEFTFDAPPQRVLVLSRPELFDILYELGVADTIVSRAGAFPDGYFDADEIATLDAVDSLGEDLDSSGHLQLSQEAILATDPDLVLGRPSGIDQAGLAARGIPLLDQPGNCPTGSGDAVLDDVYAQVEMYGEIFDRTERAAVVVADLQSRVAAAEASAPEVGAGRDIAVLYPTVGGGTTYAYGNLSMSHEQVTAAGFTNVFADTDERVFEVTVEELIDRDPDVLILLYPEGDPGPVVDAVTALPGAGSIAAVRDGAVFPQLFAFGEFASPLVIDGLERLVEEFGT